MTVRAVLLVLGLSAAVFGATPPAGADPTNPCQLAVTLLCRLVPMAPDLDHNVDLTKEPGFFNGQPLPSMPADVQPQDMPPADICLNGCL